MARKTKSRTRVLTETQARYVLQKLTEAKTELQERRDTARDRWLNVRRTMFARHGRSDASMGILRSRILGRVAKESDLLLNEPQMFGVYRPDGQNLETKISEFLHHVTQLGGLRTIIPQIVRDLHTCNLAVVHCQWLVDLDGYDEAVSNGPFSSVSYSRIDPMDFVMYPERATVGSAMVVGHYADVLLSDIETIIGDDPKRWMIEPHEAKSLQPSDNDKTVSGKQQQESLLLRRVLHCIYRGPIEEGGEVSRYRFICDDNQILFCADWEDPCSPYCIGQAVASDGIYESGSMADQLAEIDWMYSSFTRLAQENAREVNMNTFLSKSGMGLSMDADIQQQDNYQCIAVRNPQDLVPMPKASQLDKIVAILMELRQSADANSMTNDTMTGTVSAGPRTATENQLRSDGANASAVLSMREYEPMLIDIAKLTVMFLGKPENWAVYKQYHATFELNQKDIASPYLFSIAGLSGRNSLQNRIANTQLALQILGMAAQLGAETPPWMIYALMAILLADVLGEDARNIVDELQKAGEAPTIVEQIKEAQTAQTLLSQLSPGVNNEQQPNSLVSGLSQGG